MKTLLLLFSLTLFLSAQELVLDDLLKEYQDSESLYKKTKKDSAGYLLVYSREDLEKMQAHQLKDIIKTVRMYNMQISPVGYTNIKNVGAGKMSMAPIKLYIDDFEITSLLQDSALTMYMDMDIYFVDHIEIYQGGSSIAFGNEPGSMVVRLYSKDPSRENSRSAQLSVDSKGGGDLRALDAGSMGKYKYLIYADAASTKYDTYTRNGQKLSRDGKRYQAHVKFSQEDNFDIELDGIVNKSDIFNGFGSAPHGEYIERSYAYLSATKYFQNDLKVSLSMSGEKKKADNTDVLGINIPNGSSVNNFYSTAYSTMYKAIIEKKIVSGSSDLLIGAQFQQKNLDIKDYELDGNSSTPAGVDKLDIYMFYLEELYNINKNHLLAFSGKLDYYDNNLGKSSTEYALRAGYTGLFSQEYKAKIFAISRYVYPNGLQTSFTPPTYNINPNLESSRINMLSGELEYYNDKSRVVFGYGYKVIEDAISFAPLKKQYVNLEDTVYFSRVYIRGEHKFDLDNKVVVEVYEGYKDDYYSPGVGALVQLFNTIGKFDIYNGLVYREGYTFNSIKMDAGYDYTLSVTYPFTKQLKVKCKGDNLLDKASETLIGDVKVPAMEQRVIVSAEYTF